MVSEGAKQIALLEEGEEVYLFSRTRPSQDKSKESGILFLTSKRLVWCSAPTASLQVGNVNVVFSSISDVIKSGTETPTLKICLKPSAGTRPTINFTFLGSTAAPERDAFHDLLNRARHTSLISLLQQKPSSSTSSTSSTTSSSSISPSERKESVDK